MKLSQEIVNQIKEQKIEPRPRWEFMLKNYFIWILGIISLGVGSLAMAVIIYMIRANDWDLYDRLGDGLIGFVFMTLPYFWLVILGLFIFVVYYNIRHTKRGYHYNILNIILASIILSVMLGQIFYSMGFAAKIDQQLASSFPVYNKMFCQHSMVWNKPSRGIIIGQIVEPPTSREIIIHDLADKRWQVLIDQINVDDSLTLGQKIKIIGTILDHNQFMAQEIRFFGCDDSCERRRLILRTKECSVNN